MFELAVAEAYRPHVPKKDTPSSTSTPSTGSIRTDSSASSRSMRYGSISSIKNLSLFRRSKKSISMQSLVSSISPPSPSQEFQTRRQQERPASAPIILPQLPPSQPLPQEETDEFDACLETAIYQLKCDSTSGPRQLADASLAHLAHISDIAACMATSWGEFWAMIVHASKHLSWVRPSTSAETMACLLKALSTIAKIFNEEQEQGCTSTSELARIAGGTFEGILMERRQLDARLASSFAQWLKGYCGEVRLATFAFGQRKLVDSPTGFSSSAAIRVLTLGNSTMIRTAILHALTAIPDMALHVTILESGPHSEGADMAAQMFACCGDKNRLSVNIMPDSAVGTAARNIDVVLLGADRISSTGDVSNRTGALAAALCAKQLNPQVKVVVLGDVDKIAAPSSYEEASKPNPLSELTSTWNPATKKQLEGNDNIEIFREGFEWVPSSLINAYITEGGTLSIEEVERIATELGELEQYIFHHKRD